MWLCNKRKKNSNKMHAEQTIQDQIKDALKDDAHTRASTRNSTVS